MIKGILETGILFGTHIRLISMIAIFTYFISLRRSDLYAVSPIPYWSALAVIFMTAYSAPL